MLNRDLPIAFSAKARRTGEAPISSLIATVIANPDLISFAAGLVDPKTLPVDACNEISRELFSDPAEAAKALQYDTTIGLAELREQLIAHLSKLENKPAYQLGYGAGNLIVTTGSQQLLYIVADVLLDPDDIVICGDPTYFVFAGALQSFQARVLTVPMDSEGMDVDAIDALLEKLETQEQLHRVKFIYCTSYFDNPTGLTLSLSRRKRMVEIVKKYSRSHRILILEDAAYRELDYDGAPLPSIKSFDPENQWVVLAQTFSKPFAPGIKLGYSAAPHEIHEAILHQKGSHDFGTSSLCQYIACQALKSGLYARHVERLKAEYRKKRDLMLDALSRHMPREAGLSWTKPTGGLYVWVTLPTWMNAGKTGELFGRCLKNGVIYVPGEYCFYANIPPKNHLRLSFGQVDISQIEPGIARLAQAIKVEFNRKDSGIPS